MSYLKYETYNLPTAIVSNTLDYGKFDILDTTQYMKNTLGVWKALDFQFDAISSGFIVSKEQTQRSRISAARMQINSRDFP